MQIRYIDGTGCRRTADLFETFAALTRDEVASFPALRPHQRQPWHAFCVQVAALALHRAGGDETPEDAAAWRALLLALTPDWPDGEAWALAVDDWSKPALLQPPVSKSADAEAYKTRIDTADALDMLVTSKNHDLKAARVAAAGDDDWLFALVALQTQEGFMGAGNFGISRMNGGFGSRVAFGVRPAGGPGAAFHRDVVRLLAARPGMLEHHPALRDDGIGLLWQVPWDGASVLSFAALDPFYVEICRRVRMVSENGRLVARGAGSRAARVQAKSLAGMTGDPWAPVLADRTKSWGPTGSGLGYRQMARLLNPKEIARPPLAEIALGDAANGLTIVASMVVRGQGKTEGFHERRVPVSQVAKGLFNTVGGAALDRTGAVAERRAGEAGALASILRHALAVLHQGGPKRPRLDDDGTKQKLACWMRLYDDRVDAVFFDDRFWEEVAGTDAGHELAWRERLRGIGRAVLAEAAESAPRTEIRRIRAIARATSRFEGRAAGYVKELEDAA